MSDNDAFLFIVTVGFVLGWAFYLLPSIVAFRRRHPNRWLIAAVNVFLGATGIGWAVALVWAFNAAVRTVRPDGSPGGESGLNLFINDMKRVAWAGPARDVVPEPSRRLSTAEALAEIERLGRLRAAGALSEDEFAVLKAGVLKRI